MNYIALESRDVYENLAAEEYLFRTVKQGTYLLLWINDPCVVAGKYQNLYAEVRVPELLRRGIPLARRFTGGGTVYHDAGNLNYTFLGPQQGAGGAEYDVWLDRMVRALRALGIPAHRSRLCDLAIDGRKISGSAQAISGGRILHHGTLLFDTDLQELERVLLPPSSVVTSKAVPSVRANVTNICGYLIKAFGIESFRTALLKEFFPDGIPVRVLTEEERTQIRMLAQEKYRNPAWVFGRTQRFFVQKRTPVPGGEWRVELRVSQGRIQSCSLSFAWEEKNRTEEAMENTELAAELCGVLEGTPYDYQILGQLLAPYGERFLPDWLF